MHNCKFIVFVLLCAVMQLGLPCCACQPIRNAHQVIAVADSLRVNEGITCDDSLALAEAYSTLGHWRLIYPNAYARVCYYYGRMLRNRNDQVAAMRAFISGTHAPYVQRVVPLPWFTDYHILGRIYSNMGTMCHLADEFELSYEMYEQSAEQFHKSKDTTAYYYTLNAMALQLAEQRLHDETFSILNQVEHECTDANVLTKTWETKAILYEKIDIYDSAITAAKELYRRGYYPTQGYVTMAQAYWNLQMYDSALYYAQYVLSQPHAPNKNRYNMLYIVSSNESIVSAEEKLVHSEERSDIDKEILDPLHRQLTLSIELLRQDRDAKAYLMPCIIITCAIFFIILSFILTRYFRTRATTLKAKEDELSEKKQYFAKEKTLHHNTIKQIFDKTCKNLRIKSNLCSAKGLANYDMAKKVINSKFNKLIDKLEAMNVLSEREIQFCILVLLEVPQKQIAEILVYSEKSVKKTKANIAKKMQTTSSGLRNNLLDIALS